MPFANRTIELSEDVKKQIANASVASMPDMSRAVEIGAQEAEVITIAQIYNRPTTTQCDGYAPYVLQLKSPCYFAMQYAGAKRGDVDDDSDWSLSISAYRTLACLQNSAATSNGRPMQGDMKLFDGWWYIDTSDTNKETAVHQREKHDATLLTNQRAISWGKDLWMWFDGVDQWISPYILPFGTVDWYYRPLLGGHGSDSENTDNFKFFLVPTVGTPKGTLLATRTLFSGTATKSTYMNQDFVWGTPSADGSTCSLTVNSKNNGTGTSKTITQPYNIYCP